ncbi:MAG: NAD(P)-dependent oxidoreductase [Betaproteobacteria bacterium]|nr:NAD(P)-dependent oxidoreductase [Betaproteobacteria bacterium]
MEKPVIAFIGLGKMGTAMAANVRRAGYPLVVWNRTAGKAAPLIELGAKLAESPAVAAAEAGCVISSLYDDDSVRAVAAGHNGILSGMRPGAIHVGTSTISPKLANELGALHTASGQHYISGPVLGRVPAAEAGQLTAFLAGNPAQVEVVRPCVSTYASRIVFVGERPGQASTAKLIANFLVVSSMDLIGLSLAWAEKSGISPDLVTQFLDGFFAHPAPRVYIPKINDRDFDIAGFTVSGGLKDVKLMIETANDVKLKLPSAEALRAKLEQSVANGWQDKDWSCFTEIDRS